MNESYVEWLVKRPVSVGVKVLRIVLGGAAAGFALLGLLSFSLRAFLLAIVCGIGAYFMFIYMDIEYEYLYLDKELTIDKIFSKSKRKRAAVFEMENMEILVPLNSWHLDPYKNRKMKEIDYSSGIAERPEKRYVMIMGNGQKVILEPNIELVRAIKTIAPRKVFTD